MNKILLVLLAISQILSAQEIYASFDVVAQKSSKLSMQAIGIVDKINVNIGDKVKKGDVILVLKDNGEKIGLQDAKNNLDVANTALEHAKSTLNKFNKVKKVTDEQTFENIKFKYIASILEKNRAKIGIEKVKNLIDNKTLKAPFDGVIANKFIEIGEGVYSPAQPLFLIDSYPKVKLMISFDDKFANLVKIGDLYRYKISDEKQTRTGKIKRIYPNIDVKTRKVFAEVETNNIRIGKFGEGYIITDN